MRARDDRKVTPGITELSRLRVHMNSGSTKLWLVANPTFQGHRPSVLEQIDGAVCYFDVGSSYPGGAEVHRVYERVLS